MTLLCFTEVKKTTREMDNKSGVLTAVAAQKELEGAKGWTARP